MKRLEESDFKIIINGLWRNCVLDGYNAVIDCGLYDYIKNNEVTSFMYGQLGNVDMQRLYERADRQHLHSGASYGLTMREVERIVKMGYDNWKIWYIYHNRPDILEKVHVISRQVKKSLSDPSYAMCRRRLEREYVELVI